MMFRRLFPLLTAIWLQFAPMLARLEPLAAPMARPIALLLRWLASGTVVGGAFHAVSGATGLTVTAASGVIPDGEPIVATNAVGFSVRFQISSSQYGIPKTYTYLDLPPGLNRVSVKPDTLQGKPSRSGDFVTTVIGWQNANASGFTAEFSVLISVHGTPPVITLQPTNHTVDAGADVTFTVKATGEAPLTYQWMFEDLEIDATAPTLTLKNVTPELAGRYRVRVDSPAGPTFSNFATLTVNPLISPVIVTQPVDQKVVVGSAATFRVVAEGSAPLEFLWLKDGHEIRSDATNKVLTLASVVRADAGEYRVRVRNSGGEKFSDPAVLIVDAAISPPGIQSQTGDLTVFLGEIAHLSVTVTSGSGTATAAVTWQKDGVEIPGELGTTIILGPINAASAGRYRAKVQGPGGTTFSNPMTVMVAARPVISTSLGVDGFRVSFSSVPGRDYLLEARSTLGEPWQVQRKIHPLTNQTATLESVGLAARFFRVSVAPLP